MNSGLEYIKPKKAKLSERKQEAVIEKIKFWSHSFHGGLLVVIAGSLFIGATAFQLFSIEITGGEELSAMNIMIAVVLSSIALYTLKNMDVMEEIIVYSASNEQESIGYDFPKNIWVSVAAIFWSVYLTIFTIEASRLSAQLPLNDVYSQILNSSGLTEVIISSFLHILLAGSIVTQISLFMFCWHMIYRYRKGARYAVRRVLFYLSLTTYNLVSEESTTLSAENERRCLQCANLSFEKLNVDSDQWVCSHCDLPY